MNNKRELQLHESNECPCKECHNRNENYAGCHDKCLKYIDWRQRKDVIKSHVHDAKYKEYLLYKQERKNK